MAKDFTVQEYLDLKSRLRGIKRCKTHAVKREFLVRDLLEFAVTAYTNFHDEHPFSPIEHEVKYDVQIKLRREGC